jgi:large repetitive protein
MESLRYLGSGLAALSAALLAVALAAPPALAAGSVLTPSAQTVEVGETIRLSVTGFKPCPAPGSLAVLWDQSPLPYQPVAGPHTPNDFTVDFVVPSSPVGSHLITAGCRTGNTYALQQRVLVQVIEAALALTPSPPSIQAGGMVTMTGSGFALCTDPAGSTTVELSANGTPLATASGSDGAFRKAIPVPSGTPAGPYPVTAQCSAQPGSDLTSASVYVATLALSPSSGIPGTTISVAGAGYTQCHEVQLLLRDTTQTEAAGSPFVPANGSFTAELAVPSSAAPGADYQVDAGCYPAAGTSAAIAVEPFTVTSPASSTSPTPSSTPATSTSPTPSSTPASSTSPSPAHSGTTTSPRSPGSPSPQSSRHAGGGWVPMALFGSTVAGLVLAALLLVRALSMVHGRRGRGWVNKHLRVVAGSAGPLSADVERRPGAVSVSVGLEPHLDHLGHQQCEEVTAR